MIFLKFRQMFLLATALIVSQVSLTAQQCELPAPEGLTLNYITHNAATLSWVDVDGNAGYSTKLLDITDGSAHQSTAPFNYQVYDAAVIQPDHEYEFRVSAKCSNSSDGSNSTLIRFKAKSHIIIVDIDNEISLPKTTSQAPETLDFVISPTVAQSFIQLNAAIPSAQKVTYQIFDLNGKLIEERAMGAYQEGANEVGIMVPVQHLQAGVYCVVLRADAHYKVQKFIKQ